MRARLATLPLLFVPGGGNAGADARYVSLGPGPRLELTDSEIRLTTPASARGGGRVRLALAAGAHPRSVEAEAMAAARFHDYGGQDPAGWRRDVPTYQRVVYRDLYPATDLVFHGSQGRAEFDFVLRPGAAPAAIGLDVRGADRVTREGADVVLHAGDETIRLHEPVVYQEGAAGRERVNGRFTVKGRRIGFEVAAYDRTRELVIDPVVSYATYLGGVANAQQASGGVGTDAAGNIYVAIRPEPSSPVAVPGQIVKLSADGQTLLYTVNLGGMNPRGLAIDPAGNAYLIGDCGFGDPTCPKLHPIAQGRPLSSHGDFETLVVKLGPTGTLLFGTSMGGDGSISPGGIAVDSAGNIYATAFGTGGNFPVTRPLYGSEGFFTVVEAIAADTSRFLWVTGIQTGGAIVDIAAPAIDSKGAVYVTAASLDMWPTTPGVIQPTPPPLDHRVGVVAKLAADGALVYGTFFGNEQTVPTAIAVDDDGNAYITGMAGPGLPTANALQPALAGGATDAFVAKLNAGATKLLFSTYLGGKGDEGAAAIGRDASGNVYIAGPTTSTDFPQRSPLPSRFGTAASNFLAALTGDGSALVYSTYFADAQTAVADMHVTGAGTVYLAGATKSAAFPTVRPFKATLTGASQAFVAQIDPAEPSALRVVFTRPAAGATVGGTVWTDLWAENFTGTSNTFTLSIGATTVASGKGSNHVTLAWNSLAVPNGPVTLTATVRDSAGHVGTGTRSLVVANAAPLVAHFTAPAAGATVRGTTTIGMSATGASGAPVSFTLTVDGTQRFTTSGVATTASFALNTTTLADGVHTLGLTVRDGAERSASTTRALTVANGAGTFSVAVTSPPVGAVSSGRAWADVWLEGASTGTRTFTLTINGTVVGTATDSRDHVTVPWDSTKVTNGPHVLVVSVRDAPGHTGVGARDVNVQNATVAAR